MTTLRTIRSTFLLAAALGLLGAAGVSHAAVDMFLRLDGINGESADDRHKNEIDVLSWSGGLAGVIRGGGRRGQDLCVQDVAVTKLVDAATPLLYARAATGTPIATARLTIRAAGAVARDILVLEMSQVLVSSVSTSGSAGADRPAESITLNFASAKLSYTPQKPDGTPDATIVATYPGGCR